ncbi:transcription elongation factor NusA, partial [Candidatus Thorarchaeota archaeon]
MRLPVCVFDLESDMLCPSCQNKLDTGQITQFDIDFSKWLLSEAEDHPALKDLNLRRAIKAGERVILIVKKK